MKKIQFPFLGKSFVLLVFISFVSASIAQAQSTNSFQDKNNDCISDNLTHQFLDLYQDAFTNSKDTGDVIHTIPTPASNSQGLTWDGNYLWCSDISTAMIYQVDPVDGGIVKSFDAPGNSVEGLAWDGTYLWASENGGGPFEPDYIYKIDPEDGAVISSFVPEIVWVHGLTWDGQYLWMIDFSTKEIHQTDPVTGLNVHTIETPETGSVGVTWDGTYLWTDDFSTDKLYCINPIDGSIIFEVNSPHTNPRDLAWDGEYLWVLAAASYTIYQVDVAYVTSIDELDSSTSNLEALTVYPNPMEKSATISYTLKEQENIQLQLYNSNGVLVKTLAKKDQLRGDHQFKLNAKDLAAGVYYCVLQTTQESLVKKIVKVD